MNEVISRTYNVSVFLHLQRDVQIKEELTAAKLEMDRMVNALEEEYQSNLKKKDEVILILKHILEERSQVCAIETCYEIGNPLSLSMMTISHKAMSILPYVCISEHGLSWNLDLYDYCCTIGLRIMLFDSCTVT